MANIIPPASKDRQPLSPAVFAILLALAGGEKHGYAIMKEAAEPAGGAIKMGPGTLYGSIDRMIRDSLVEETGFTDDDRRRYYRITSLGLKVFSAELSRIGNIVRAARSKPLPKGARA
jgi:DNA-binding PadR family transcriptional regulator